MGNIKTSHGAVVIGNGASGNFINTGTIVHKSARPADLKPQTNPSTEPSPSTKPTVYLSYAWNGDSGKTADGLNEALSPWVDVRQDKFAISNGGSIRAFEEEIGRGVCVVMVLSENYFKSIDCMRELSFVWQASQRNPQTFAQKAIPVVLGDAKISNMAERLAHVAHWQESKAASEAHINQTGAEAAGRSGVETLQDHTAIIASLADALACLADIVMPRGYPKLLESNFQPVVDLVKKRFNL